MQSLETITSPIANELERFEKEYASILQSKCDLLNSSIEVILASSGKKIRPVLNFLVAKNCGQITDSTLASSVFLELLHTATLLHDDVVDDTLLRRGKPSLNAVYQNKIAVLVGDYFLSSSLIMAMQTSNLQLISIVSATGRELSEGELFQLESTREQLFTEERYNDIIFRKTASLFSACCQIGAITGGADKDTADRYKEFGKHIGMAFQLKDDIFDYFEEEEIGKPTGNDLREGKITLPLLYALNHAEKREAQPLLEAIHQKDFSPENIARLIAFAKEQGGIEYAEAQIEMHVQKALAVLAAIPTPNDKTALTALAHHIGHRSR
jgi:octaprenyl-diphosphate synthase